MTVNCGLVLLLAGEPVLKIVKSVSVLLIENALASPAVELIFNVSPVSPSTRLAVRLLILLISLTMPCNVLLLLSIAIGVVEPPRDTVKVPVCVVLETDGFAVVGLKKLLKF